MEKEELLVEIGTGFYVEKTPKTRYLEPSQRNQSELTLRNEATSSDVMGVRHGIETGIQNNDKANWQIKVLARIQRDCPWYQGCTLTSEQNPKSHRKMVALELDTNDGHGTIKSNQPQERGKIGSKITNQS
jgi:hypothetical protein